MKKKIQNKLGTYLAVTAGIGCAASAANAAVVFYGPTATPPTGIGFGVLFGFLSVADLSESNNSLFAYEETSTRNAYFTRGEDLNEVSSLAPRGAYRNTGNFVFGAAAGMQNYANISFDGNNIVEAVAQFYFDGAGGGYLIAIATTNPIPNPQNLSAVGGPALSISAGKAMIDAAAAVPEPSSLMLLALGATGLAARRQRKKAA